MILNNKITRGSLKITLMATLVISTICAPFEDKNAIIWFGSNYDLKIVEFSDGDMIFSTNDQTNYAIISSQFKNWKSVSVNGENIEICYGALWVEYKTLRELSNEERSQLETVKKKFDPVLAGINENGEDEGEEYTTRTLATTYIPTFFLENEKYGAEKQPTEVIRTDFYSRNGGRVRVVSALKSSISNVFDVDLNYVAEREDADYINIISFDMPKNLSRIFLSRRYMMTITKDGEINMRVDYFCGADEILRSYILDYFRELEKGKDEEKLEQIALKRERIRTQLAKQRQQRQEQIRQEQIEQEQQPLYQLLETRGQILQKILSQLAILVQNKHTHNSPKKSINL